jgi:GTP pyrophosphokinase
MENKVQAAFDLMNMHHKGQFRKNKQDGTALPYMFHPIAVMQLIWSWGIGTHLVLAAALCHDLLEDTKCTVEILRTFLGAIITGWIQDLSFIPKADTKDVKKLKEAYMLTFQKKPIEVVVIKMADRFCNVRDFLQNDPQYAMIYFKKAESLFDTFDARRVEVIERFGPKVYAKIRKTYVDVCQELGIDA